jgi:hypothetical protein
MAHLFQTIWRFGLQYWEREFGTLLPNSGQNDDVSSYSYDTSLDATHLSALWSFDMILFHFFTNEKRYCYCTVMFGVALCTWICAARHIELMHQSTLPSIE